MWVPPLIIGLDGRMCVLETQPLKQELQDTPMQINGIISGYYLWIFPATAATPATPASYLLSMFYARFH